MTTLQEQLHRKRVPIDTWDTKEKLLLASAVVRSGDQNWMSVSRLLKTQGHSTRPTDWYSQKNCAAQYFLLLEHVETPKRKKRTAGSEVVMETPSESILRSLREERIVEIKKLMIEEKRLYLKLKDEINCVRTGRADETLLREMCLQIDQEKKQKEKEALVHADWLKQREEKKLELERQWRPTAKLLTAGQKRKLSEAVDGLDSPKLETNSIEESSHDTTKPAMSPLLTSLLKSPSPAPNSASSILHSAITNTNQRGTSPTIASLLSSSPEVTVSPGIQQLVSTAIGQEPSQTMVAPTLTPIGPLESRLMATTIPTRLQLPPERIIPTEVKKEPLQSVISDNIEEEIQLIEEVLKNVEENESKDRKEDVPCNESVSNKIGEIKNELDKAVTKSIKEESDVDEVFAKFNTPEITHVSSVEKEERIVSTTETCVPEIPAVVEPPPRISTTIREVSVVLEDLDNTQQGVDVTKEVEAFESDQFKETTSSGDSNIKLEEPEDTNESSTTEDSQPLSTDGVSGSKDGSKDDDEKPTETVEEIKFETIKTEVPTEKEVEVVDCTDNIEVKISDEIEIADETQKSVLTDESDFDDLAISVIKTEKIKRDYSRTKKKEDKEIDFLLVDEKDDNTNDAKDMDDTESNDIEKKFEAKHKNKLDVDRSDSPWTEEESEVTLARTRRRHSTPATPSDSVPNSPASSVAGFEDDRDYRAWKKSIMLMYNRLATHKYASLFLRPITDDQAPGYHSIIREPKDLQTLRRNIDNGQIKTTPEFVRYVLIMFQNAIMYNKTNDYVYNMAKEMQEECIAQIQVLVNAQAETSPRRELRTSEPGLKQKADIPPKSRKRKLE